ncbi:hypothetical protein AALM74_05435 [Parabacteroides segnis]|uniref:hypothetical protein n=1 Tax=Parabacteroides segnis TaxID=2763058 RepID=UPI003513CE7A
MKIKLFITLSVFFFSSCSYQAESVADKAMKELGDGKYYDQFGLGLSVIDLFHKEESLFSDVEATSIAVKDKSSEFDLRENIITTDFLFSEYKLSSKKDRKVDLYGFSYKPVKDTSTPNVSYEEQLKYYEEFKDIMRQDDSNEYKLCFDNNNSEIGFSYLRYKNVPLYEFRYKLDNRYLADMHVINLPDKGLKVTMFRLVK